MDTQHHTVLITGASGGIGRAMCEEFKSAGYRVIATDIDDKKKITCDQFINADLKLICRNEDYRDGFIQQLNLSDSGLTALVNNAATQILNKTDEILIQDWQDTLDVNLLAPFIITQALLPALEKNKGSVVNLGSVHAVATKPRFVAYATSKAALVGMTHALAVDLGDRVRVNAINPAAVETPMLVDGFKGKQELYRLLAEMHPLGRIAKPTEIAQVAVFLCSKGASFISGAVIDVDGGVLSRLHDPD
jgi:NAD(P)-dependent dehydrogenase (short-subunit alcohol dehydrogenase family)